MKRFLWLEFVLFFYVIWSGCGDTFRPIIIPNPPTFPNPEAAHSVVSINDNGTVVPGSAMVIDVSGDSEMSAANVNVHPVHAAQQSANEVLVVNQAVTGLNVPTTSCLVAIPPTPPNQVFDVCPSITKLNFSSSTISSTSSISLPIYSGANFVAVAPSATTAYVTLPTYPPNPDQPLPQTIVPSVGVVNINTNSVVATIPVSNNPGANPYALAVTPDNTKLYVANQGDGTISAFNTFNSINLSPRAISGTLSSAPVWLVARSDSQAVYVLEANGTLAYLNIISTAGPDILTESAISVPGAVKMVYDSNKNRLYIPGGSTVAIVDVSQSTPSTTATETITPITPQGPCSAATAATTFYTVDVAALPDGSRAYVGSYYEDANDNICPQVTVIDAMSYAVESVIAVPGFPAYDAFCALPVSQQGPRFRIMMAAAGDSSRAYLSSCDGGNVNFVDTSTDTYIQNLPAPASSRSQNPPQNPVFLLAGP